MNSFIARGLFITLIFLGASFNVAAESWADVAEEIGVYLDESVRLYEQGEGDAAKQQRYDAYFRVYELKEMEQAVQSWFGGKYNFMIEDMFAEITRIVNEGRPAKDLATVRDELRAVLLESAIELDIERPREDVSHAAIFWKAFLILLREGMEAILILGIMIAILVKRNRPDQKKIVYTSAIGGILASLILAVLLNVLRERIGITKGYIAQELFEGFVILAAVAVLLWVCGWLIKTSSNEMAHLKKAVDEAVVGSRVGALALVSFLAVFREGAETVLFYQAMFADVSPERYGLIGLGMAAAVVGLVVGFALVRYGSIKLPLKLFFSVTGVFIFYMAFSMAGKAFLEFKEAGWIQSGTVNFPTITWLGIYPLLPGLLLQGSIIIFAVAMLVINKKNVIKPSVNDGEK